MSALLRFFENLLLRFVEDPDTRLAALDDLLRDAEARYQQERAENLKKSRFHKFKNLIGSESRIK